MKDTEGYSIYQTQDLETGEVIGHWYEDNTPVPPSKIPVTAQEECDFHEPEIENCYEARHIVDASGARYLDFGPVDYIGPDLDVAIKCANARTEKGQSGYVVNAYTNERLMPDGTWE